MMAAVPWCGASDALILSVREVAVPNTTMVLRKISVLYKLNPEDDEVTTCVPREALCVLPGEGVRVDDKAAEACGVRVWCSPWRRRASRRIVSACSRTSRSRKVHRPIATDT